MDKRLRARIAFDPQVDPSIFAAGRRLLDDEPTIAAIPDHSHKFSGGHARSNPTAEWLPLASSISEFVTDAPQQISHFIEIRFSHLASKAAFPAETQVMSEELCADDEQMYKLGLKAARIAWRAPQFSKRSAARQ
jgi:hypothetical protein